MGFKDQYSEDFLSKRADLIEQVKNEKTKVGRRQFMREFVNANLPDVRPMTLDREYSLISKDTFDEIIALDGGDNKTYVPEERDCDDYAGYLKYHLSLLYKVNSVGMVISEDSKHAFNLVPFSDGSAKLLEPQRDAYVRPGSEKFQVENELVIF